MSGKNVVCIEIGPDFIRAVEVSRTNKAVGLEAAVEMKTPEEFVNDGFLSDVNELAAYISKGLRRYKITNPNVIFSVVSSQVLSRNVTIPAVRTNQIDAVVKTQADELFPVDLAGYIITHSVTTSSGKQQGKAGKQKKGKDSASASQPSSKKMDLVVYAAPENMIKGYYDLANRMGLIVEKVDYTGNSSYQWMKRAFGPEPVMMINVGRKITQATIMKNSRLNMQRSIGYGISDMLDTAVNTNMAADEDSAAEMLKNGQYINLALSGNYADDVVYAAPEPGIEGDFSETVESAPSHNDAARQATASGNPAYQPMTDAARGLVGNLINFVDYYKSRNDQQNLQKILLIGEGAAVRALDQLLQNELNIQVISISDIPGGAHVRGFKNVDSLNLSCFIPAIGASIAPISFVPYSVRNQIKKRANFLRYVKIFVSMIVICFLVIMGSLVMYVAAAQKNQSLKAEAKELEPIETVYQAYLDSQSINTEVNTIDTSTNEYNEILNLMFNDLQNNMPSLAVIQRFISSDGTVTLDIVADKKETAAKFLLQMYNLKYLNNVSIDRIQDGPNEDTGIWQIGFTATASFNPDAVTQYRDQSLQIRSLTTSTAIVVGEMPTASAIQGTNGIPTTSDGAMAVTDNGMAMPANATSTQTTVTN